MFSLINVELSSSLCNMLPVFFDLHSINNERTLSTAADDGTHNEISAIGLPHDQCAPNLGVPISALIIFVFNIHHYMIAKAFLFTTLE